jgi:CHRD domain
MPMRRRVVSVALVLGAIGMLMLSPPAGAVQRFELTLTGAAEVPGPGDPDGTGTASFTFNRGTRTVCWEVTVEDITLPAIGAHIHVVPPDPGPIVVPITAPDASGMSAGCTTASRELIKAITKDPSSYYFNVHTTDFPGGALRSQLG